MNQENLLQNIRLLLAELYEPRDVDPLAERLKTLMDSYRRDETILRTRTLYRDQLVINEKDAFLIAYPDALTRDDEPPIRTLHRFLSNHVGKALTGVHLLPFYPSSSDGGYSVVDFKAVDPNYGEWTDVAALAEDYRLMVDLVMNHVSARSAWFQGFLQGDPKYQDYFLWSEEPPDLPEVFRPRTHPLFTRFETAKGPKFVWTTFSRDQIDLNFKNPDVLLEMVDVLMFYLTQGTEMIRLDAVGYIWKEQGTSCVNLPQTHRMVGLLRKILDYAAPYAAILTEANFPDPENLAYFGQGHEADLVYNFSLPPLTVDALARQDARYLMEETQNTPQDHLFFDFLASHDGIGLLAAKKTLPPNHFDNLLQTVTRHNGLISYKSSAQGPEPYELNISYFDAINDPNSPDDPWTVERFAASQAVMFFLKGIPAIYYHSLLGSRNDAQGVEETGQNRAINREKLEVEKVLSALADENSLRFRVFHSLLTLLDQRKYIPCFNPSGEKEIVDYLDPRLLVLERRFLRETVTVLINLSDQAIGLDILKGRLDLIGHESFSGSIRPYQVALFKGSSIKPPINPLTPGDHLIS